MTAIDTAKALIFTGGTIPTSGASSGDLAAETAARQAAIAALASNVGKIFQSRQQAVDAGQANLPASYGIILTLENGDLVFRAPGTAQSTDDPLFPGTYPSWHVILRIYGGRGVLSFNVPGGITSENPPATTTTFIARDLQETSVWRRMQPQPDPAPVPDPDDPQYIQDGGDQWWERTWSSRDVLDLIGDSDAAWQAADEELRAADADLQGQIADLTGYADPGNKVVSISEDEEGFPTVGVVSDTGRLWSLFGLDMSDAQVFDDPGNSLHVFVESENHVPILAVDLANNRLWAFGTYLTAPSDPGNNLIVFVDDLNGSPVIGWDVSTNSLWLAGSTEDGGGIGGSTVEFVDPVTGVQPYMAIESGQVVRYMDAAKWPGHMIGFEQRIIGQLPVAIAQTPDPALGIVAFGGGTTYVQTPANDYPWHVLDTDLSASGDSLEAQRSANEFLTGEDAENDTLYTIFALSEPVSSTVEADALSGSTYRQSILNKVTAAQASAEAFGKRLYIDRIHLSLLEGQPNISQAAADLHYAGVSQDMALELATAAKQGALPITVVTQSFGTRDNGVSNVALAEGRLHWNHWSLGIVCATPRYPFPLQAGSLALHTETAALQIAELQNVAALAKLGGHGTGWFCPSLENATITGNVITAQFSSMDDTLVIRDAANHGFSIDGDSAGAVITDVSVSGVYATITLDIAPVDGGSGLFLNYAYGQTGDPGDGFAANRGSITDSWSMESRHGGTLYRYALSNRVAITAA